MMLFVINMRYFHIPYAFSNATVEIVIMHITGSLDPLDYWGGESSFGGGKPPKRPCTMGYTLPID